MGKGRKLRVSCTISSILIIKIIADIAKDNSLLFFVGLGRIHS